MQLDFFAAFIQSQPDLSVTLRAAAPGASHDRKREQPKLDDVAPLVAAAREWLRAAGCARAAERVSVRWNPRMRSSAGTARAAHATIDLNPRLLPFGEAEVMRTLKHEVAHLIAFHRAGRRRIAPHGREWRTACHELGLPDESRCHTLPLPARSLERRHRYRCPACNYELARVRPLRRACACIACCRAHANGPYDERFRFVKVRR
jgi:predicted SprT family Zn-dependent metalloprotease